jgi:hypothetical protein
MQSDEAEFRHGPGRRVLADWDCFMLGRDRITPKLLAVAGF